MLKLYQIVMACAALALGAMCIRQRALQVQSGPATASSGARPATAPPPAAAEPAASSHRSNQPAVSPGSPAPAARPDAPAAAEGDDAARAADIVSDLLTNRKRLDTIRAFSSPELDSLYAPLFRSLGLAPDEIDLFKDLAMARQIAQAELRIREQEAETDAELLALQDQRTRAMAWFDDRARELLGQGHFETLQAYDRSLSERTMLFDFKQGLDNVGRSLSYEQEDRLIRLMYDERKQVPVLDALFSAGGHEIESAREDLLREFDGWKDRVLLKCAHLLSNEQLKALEAQLVAQRGALEQFLKSPWS